MKILAAVVTYNRINLLLRCIDKLQNQTRPPDHLLVINNGSTDNTQSILHARSIHVITQSNLGSAGGWHRAIDFCIANSFDAIWLMDDDGMPDLRSLELLEAQLTSGVSCVSSVVLQQDSPDRFVFPFPLLNDQNNLPVLFRFPRKVHTLADLSRLSPSGLYPFAHLFNGSLISAQAIKKIGNVNPKYFIFGDEVDYFYRLRSVGHVLSLLSAHHFHPDVSNRPYTYLKILYYIRNTLILNRLYLDNPLLRNLLALIVVFARTVRRNGIFQALYFFFGPQSPHLCRAIRAGIKSRLEPIHNV